MNNKNTFTRDRLSHAIKNALSGVVCSLLFVLPVHAVEFNVDMIDAEDREGNDSNLLIVFYVQIMPDDFVMQLHR
ncbi:hypothetical protein POX35_22330, partial [Escherichia fergusonii]